MLRSRWSRIVSAVVAGSVLVSALLFGEQLVWLATAGLHQADLLYGRVPIEEAITAGHYDEDEIAKLRLIPPIKAFGETIGLSATDNYDTINPTWDHTIWNVSGCQPLRFENKRWWFPIVGSVPYLGFFDKPSADAFVAELENEGLDAYARTAGAYSTLGWFRDPVMPAMLEWPEYSLANTVLHELAHATVWVPGSVQFNESFANFVGDEASRRYMIATYGESSSQVADMQARVADSTRWRAVMHELYRDLDAVYTDPTLSDDAKRERKAALFGSVDERVEAAGFAQPDRWKRVVAARTWNNATMMQFRTYNRSRDWFAALYEQEDRDLHRFMHRVPEVTAGADDPYAALARAVGETP